jgi:hypothetical protein
MQQTRGGRRRVEASWSAIPQAAVITGEGKVVRPSQLIRSVLRASWWQFGKGSRATDVLLRTTGHGRQATDAATTRWRRKTATDEGGYRDSMRRVAGLGRRAVEQGDAADEAGASDGASQLIPSVRRTTGGLR